MAHLNLHLVFLVNQVSIYEFFSELDALELEQLKIFFDVTIERHAYLPWTSKNLRILDCRLIQKVVRSERRVTFDDMYGITMEISGAVEPGAVVLIRHLNNQCVPFPVPYRPAHPGIRGNPRLTIHVDDASCARI